MVGCFFCEFMTLEIYRFLNRVNMRVKQAYHLMGHEHVLKLNFLHYIVRLYRF